MPKLQRINLPLALLNHLADRVIQRSVSAADLRLLAAWMDTNPTVPDGLWYKVFPTFTICGNGALVSTFLTSMQVPKGVPVK